MRDFCVVIGGYAQIGVLTVLSMTRKRQGATRPYIPTRVYCWVLTLLARRRLEDPEFSVASSRVPEGITSSRNAGYSAAAVQLSAINMITYK